MIYLDLPEGFEVELDEEDFETDTEDPEKIKRKIKVVEEELENLSDVEWIYAKRLLKYGLACWIFGLATFISVAIIYKGPGLLLNAPPLSISLLVLAGATVVVVSAILIQRYQKEMDKLEDLRKKLLSRYESMLLKKVEENIS